MTLNPKTLPRLLALAQANEEYSTKLGGRRRECQINGVTGLA
jgi:hypothetical protein